MFMIISPEDSQVYEVKLTSNTEITYLHELIAYSSIDLVEAAEWTTSSMYLKTVDKFNDLLMNCFVTPGRMRFLLIHTWKNKDDAIKNFFCDVYEYYTKALLNPFVDKNTKITSQTFDRKIKELIQKLR